MNRNFRVIHSILNLSLSLAAVLLMTSDDISPNIKYPVGLMIWGSAIGHARSQKLTSRDYLEGARTAATTVATSAGSALLSFGQKAASNPKKAPELLIKTISLEAARALQQKGEIPLDQLWLSLLKNGKKLGRSLLFLGSSGESKSVTAQYLLWLWAQNQPDLTVMVHDPNFGVNDDPNYASVWLGLPTMKRCPDNIQSCVVTGKADELEDFIALGCLLVRQREKEVEAALDSGEKAPVFSPAVFVVDELTTSLEELKGDSQMGSKTNARINTTLKVLATQGRKYSVYFWAVGHTNTGGETLLDRTILRQTDVLMGAKMTMDESQVRNSPQPIPSRALKKADEAYAIRKGVLPVGFCTNVPLENDCFLPYPPIESTQDLVLDVKFANGQTLKECEFLERIKQPEIEQAIESYLRGSLEAPDGKEKPKQYLFRLVWGKALSGRLKEEQDILNRYLDQFNLTESKETDSNEDD